MKALFLCAVGLREEDQPAEADGVLSASSGHRGPALRPVALLPHGDGAADHHQGPPGIKPTHVHTKDEIHSTFITLTCPPLLSVASASHSGVCQWAESSVRGPGCGGEQQTASQRPGGYPTGKCVCVCLFIVA